MGIVSCTCRYTIYLNTGEGAHVSLMPRCWRRPLLRTEFHPTRTHDKVGPTSERSGSPVRKVLILVLSKAPKASLRQVRRQKPGASTRAGTHLSSEVQEILGAGTCTDAHALFRTGFVCLRHPPKKDDSAVGATANVHVLRARTFPLAKRLRNESRSAGSER